MFVPDWETGFHAKAQWLYLSNPAQAHRLGRPITNPTKWRPAWALASNENLGSDLGCSWPSQAGLRHMQDRPVFRCTGWPQPSCGPAQAISVASSLPI